MPRLTLAMPVAAMSAFARPYVSTFCPRAARGIGEALAERVVGVDDLRVQPGPREELRLRRAVGRHRAVIVEMVAREIGEQRDVEGDAVDAALIETVRRHLHRDRARTRRLVAREHLLQLRRIRRRMGGRLQRADRPLPSVPTTAARRPQRSRHCAIHCVHDVLPLVPVTPTTHSACDGLPKMKSAMTPSLCFKFSTGKLRHGPVAIPREALRFPQHRARTARERVGDELAAVGLRSGIGGERVAWLHLPAVGGDAPRPRAEPRESAGTSSSGSGSDAITFPRRRPRPAAAGSRCRRAHRSARRACAARRRSPWRTRAPPHRRQNARARLARRSLPRR